MQLGHVVVGERIAGRIVDLEAKVEFEHVQELGEREGRMSGFNICFVINNQKELFIGCLKQQLLTMLSFFGKENESHKQEVVHLTYN